MKVSVYGTGYVGLVSGVCLAELGHDVVCLDINEPKIAQLNAGESPIHEKGLSELLSNQLNNNRISFTSDYAFAACHGEVHLIAVGTPSLPDGNADMQYVFAVADSISTHCDKDLVIVNKSTVPVGSGEKVEKLMVDKLHLLDKPYQVSVVSNPEFLREGAAVNDFMAADRIVVGCSNEHSELVMRTLYQPLTVRGVDFIVMNRESAELTKYAANGLLATKISFINEMSQIAERIGADIEEVSRAIGFDHRIGPHYNQAGCGYGGSCFPKDVKALINIAKSSGVEPTVIQAVDDANDRQRLWLATQVTKALGDDLSGKTIGVWGLAFKPETDDIRQAASLYLIEALLAQGGQVFAYDPVAISKVQQHFVDRDNIQYADSALEALHCIDALVIVTEWDEFRQFDLSVLAKKMQHKPIIDGRNILSQQQAKEYGLHYISVGRPVIQGV